MKTTDVALSKNAIELRKLKRKIDKAVRKKMKKRLRNWTFVSLDYDYNHNVVRSAIKYARDLGWKAVIEVADRHDNFISLTRYNTEEIAKLLRVVTEKIDREAATPNNFTSFYVDLPQPAFREELRSTGVLEKLKKYARTKGVFLQIPDPLTDICRLTFYRLRCEKTKPKLPRSLEEFYELKRLIDIRMAEEIEKRFQELKAMLDQAIENEEAPRFWLEHYMYPIIARRLVRYMKELGWSKILKHDALLHMDYCEFIRNHQKKGKRK